MWGLFFGPLFVVQPERAVQPIVLQTRFMSLTFDGRTGAWISWIDRQTGQELLARPLARAMVEPPTPPKLDLSKVQQALQTGQALSLEGEWVFTPDPEGGGEAVGYLEGRFDQGQWLPTPIPSRLGVGDNQLHNRKGVFWYRREFTLPPEWASKDLTLLLGAVDDFDVTYLNGHRIGQTGEETPHHWEAPRWYRVPPEVLRRAQPNVLLIKVTNSAYDGGILGPVVLGLTESLGKLEEALLPVLSQYSLTREAGEVHLKLVARSRDYEYQMEYTLWEDQPLIVRQLTLRNISPQRQVLRGLLFPLPFISLGSQQKIIFPGTLPVGDFSWEKLKEGEILSPRSRDPLVVLWEPEKKIGLGSWYYCEEEYAPVSVRRWGSGLEIRHHQQILAPLKVGQSVTLGKQFIWLSRGSRDEALKGVHRVYQKIHLLPPPQSLSHLKERILYCGHPGGTPEQKFIGYGGFKALQAYLPTLQKMGIDLLWLLPIWEHGDGKQWNLYAPFDHFQVSPLYGTPEELKALSKECARRGIALMFDLVPHGPPDFTPLAKEHPEWICRDEDGKFHYEWGQVSFDYAHPGWQEYMRRVAEWDAREFGALGARVDVAAGSPPNWNSEVGYRPSYSTLGGGLGMNDAIREGFLKVNKETILLPEEYTGANIFYRVADLTYDAQLFFLMVDLEARKAPPEEWAWAFQQFLHDQALTLPLGALKMRWISNHDTVSWTFQKKRPVQVYGVPCTQALWALCAFIEGVPMLYQGDEDPSLYGGEGVSHVEFLTQIYQTRRNNPALSRGSADYLAIKATGGVFACLRESLEQQAVVLISFNPSPIETALKLPRRLSGEWQEVWTQERRNLHSGVRLLMRPYQVQVWVRPVLEFQYHRGAIKKQVKQ